MGATTEKATPDADARELGARSLSPVMARYFERTWVRGDGHRLYDTEDKAYLDFATGIAVTILGHHHPRVTAAVHNQAVHHAPEYARHCMRLRHGRTIARAPKPPSQLSTRSTRRRLRRGNAVD